MVYKYPDKNGNMIETPHLNTFIKGIDGAIKHGYGPGHNSNYQAPKSQKITFAQAQARLRREIGTGFADNAADRARAEFASMVGFAVAKELQAAGAVSREQAPIASGRTATPGQKRQGLSWADASRKLKAELGDHFLDEGAAPLAKSKGLGPRAVRRFHEPMPGCKLMQL